ncbi:MAG: insulinase family protein [Saprospiraceae bacterium]|nr:insulinase family protein [Saprospiraceae bacterium]
MKFKYFLPVVALFFAFSASAQQVEFVEYDLDNGLHVILHQDNSNPIVAVSVLYHVGSKNEKEGRTGFAHFFEHLLFEGSENIDRGEFDKYVSSAGGVNNANTSTDRTYYYELFPSNQLALGLWLESERMLHAKVDNKGIETQREVVKEEKRLRVDNQPYMQAIFTDIPAQLYKKHPYKHSVIGSMEDLNAAQEEDYKEFYATYYVPNNATLSIAGDIDIEQAKKLISDYFSDIPAGTTEIPRPNVVEDPITTQVVDTLYDKNVQIPAVLYAYRTPKQTDKDAYTLQIISSVLSDGQSSRFVKNIVNDKKLALASGSFLNAQEDYGSFIIYGLINQGVEVEELAAAMDEEIVKLQENGITERELQKQINNLEKQFIQSNRSMAGIAESLADYHVYFGDANLINTELDRYREITVEDVKRVAKQYLKSNQRVSSTVYPGDDSKTSN